MSYDYQKLFAAIVRAVSADAPLDHRMMAVIDECESQRAHKDWAKLRKIDFNADACRLAPWLMGSLAEAATPNAFQGLWFGLNNPVVQGNDTADIYIAASENFDGSSLDWACNAEFYPSAGNLHSIGLTAIYKLAYNSRNGLQNDAEYPLVLAYGAMLARTALESLNIASASLPMLKGAAVGFDSGDLLFLGTVEDGAFKTQIRAG